MNKKRFENILTNFAYVDFFTDFVEEINGPIESMK